MLVTPFKPTYCDYVNLDHSPMLAPWSYTDKLTRVCIAQMYRTYITRVVMLGHDTTEVIDSFRSFARPRKGWQPPTTEELRDAIFSLDSESILWSGTLQTEKVIKLGNWYRPTLSHYAETIANFRLTH